MNHLTSTMQAIVLQGYGGPEQFAAVELPVPVPRDGEVLVQLRASGVCYHDVMARQGHFPRTALPGVIGHEMAGEVAALGRRAAGFAAGDRVAILMKDHCGHCRHCVRARDHLCENGSGLFGEATPGGYAEYVAVPASALVHIPAGVSYEQAAVVPCALGTAYHGLQKVAAVQPGEAVLITGASGGVGIHAVQVARMLGARTIAVTTSEAKRAFLQSSPDTPAYLSWLAPNWRLRIGDCRTRLEAERLLRDLRSAYPGCYIVPDQIEMASAAKARTPSSPLPAR